MNATSCVKFSETLWNTHEDIIWSNEFIEQVTEAAKQGFFYLEMPAECHKLINEGVEFANTFYKNAHYRNIQPTNVDYTGFIDRKNDQCESLYLGESHWKQELPKDVATLAIKMNELSIKILKVFFRQFSIAQTDYDLASGGVTSNEGSSIFAFHHYRSESKKEGLGAHKDFGHITLLFANTPGLQFKVNDQWVDARPLDGYFIVNLGRTLENLIDLKDQLIAPIHRVIQCSEERISFLAQVENNYERPLYKKIGEQLIKFHGSCREYVDNFIETKDYIN